MIWSLIQSGWHFVFGWAGVDILIGAAAVAIAILEPKQLDAITDLRKWAIGVAVIAFTLTGAIAYGYRNGIAEMQRQLGNSLAKEAHDGEQAGEDADRTVLSDTPDRVRNDKWNRDNWIKPGSK
jgi:hypothetical protein